MHINWRAGEDLKRVRTDFELSCEAVGVAPNERLMFRYFGRIMSGIVSSETAWRRIFKEDGARPDRNIALLLDLENLAKLERLLKDEPALRRTLQDIETKQAMAENDPWSGLWYEVRIGEDLDNNDVRKLFVSSALIYAPPTRSQKIEMVRSTAVWSGSRATWNNHLEAAMERLSDEPGDTNRWAYYVMPHPVSGNSYCMGLTMGVRGTGRSLPAAFASRVIWLRRPELGDGDNQAWWDDLKLDEPRQRRFAVHRTFAGDKVQKRTIGGFDDVDFHADILDAAVNALMGTDFVNPPKDYSDARVRLLEVGSIRGDWPFRVE